MRLAAIPVIVALLAGPASAMDGKSNFYVLGAGAVRCSSYLTATPEQKLYAETWMAGYTSAMNRATADTYNLRTISADEAKTRIEQYRQSNPDRPSSTPSTSSSRTFIPIACSVRPTERARPGAGISIGGAGLDRMRRAAKPQPRGHPDREAQLARVIGLAQDRDRAQRLHSGAIGPVRIGGDEDDARRALALDQGCRLDAVQAAGEVDVHDNDVRRKAVRQLDGGLAAGGAPDNVAIHRDEIGDESQRDQRLVLDDEDPRQGRSG